MLVDVHLRSCWSSRQAGHRHHVPEDGDDESCTCVQSEFTNGHREACGSAEKGWVVRERVLRLRHADRKGPIAPLHEAVQLALRRGFDQDPVRTLEFGGDSLGLVEDAHRCIDQGREGSPRCQMILTCGDHGSCKGRTPCTPFTVNRGSNHCVCA